MAVCIVRPRYRLLVPIRHQHRDMSLIIAVLYQGVIHERNIIPVSFFILRFVDPTIYQQRIIFIAVLATRWGSRESWDRLPARARLGAGSVRRHTLHHSQGLVMRSQLMMV